MRQPATTITSISSLFNIITIIVILSLFFIKDVEAQVSLECQTFDLSSSPLTGSTCAPFVSSQISFFFTKKY